MENVNLPSYDIVSGQKYKDKKSGEEKINFTRVGVGFSRKEGKKGYFLKFHLKNTNGEYYLLPKTQKKEDKENTPF